MHRTDPLSAAALALLLGALALPACSNEGDGSAAGEDSGADSGFDAVPYVPRDTVDDTESDDAGDADERDAALDASEDVGPDANDDASNDAGDDAGGTDAAVPDADATLDAGGDAGPDASVEPPPETLGVRRVDGVTTLAVLAPNATRVEAWFYEEATGVTESARIVLDPVGEGHWTARAEGVSATYYGLRVWGPNWTYTEAWEPGSDAGFVVDVDEVGNRFNPNKLLLDPYALEMSHDPATPSFDDWSIYRSGPEERTLDSALHAPKGVVIDVSAEPEPRNHPVRALRDDVVYEVHVRGLTRNDPSVPEELRGTYAGAALKAQYLAELGVTAVEFLPLHETQNDRNDVSEGTSGDNYWGYASLSFFAPDRRYAFDQSPGGPTRELRAMVDAFHAQGIKVFVDVVYNHTGEGGSWGEQGEYANLLSWRGMDNATWYHSVDGSRYRNDNGVGPNLRFTHNTVRRHVIDSLTYWHEHIGVDGFRFDLASVLGNRCEADCFEYDPTGLITDISLALARSEDNASGVDLIAEPWGTSAGTYQVGNYPQGWHEWNDRYRISLRSAMNEPWAPPTPAELAMRLHGSSDLYRDDGRGPDAGLGYVVSHDGFTWADLFRCTSKVNDQPWPFGPSDGGSDYNQGADYGGDAALQRQAARTTFALMALSAPPPMLTGGDEFLRTQYCNNNPYNLDSIANWLDWQAAEAEAERHTLFVRRMLALRHAHPALRPLTWTEGVDRDDDGLPDITWYDQNGTPPGDGFWDNPSAPILGWRVDANENAARQGEGLAADTESILVMWNRGDDLLRVPLPELPEERGWWRMADTAAWLEGSANSHAFDDPPLMPAPNYDIHPGSVVVWIER